MKTPGARALEFGRQVIRSITDDLTAGEVLGGLLTVIVTLALNQNLSSAEVVDAFETLYGEAKTRRQKRAS